MRAQVVAEPWRRTSDCRLGRIVYVHGPPAYYVTGRRLQVQVHTHGSGHFGLEVGVEPPNDFMATISVNAYGEIMV